MLWLNDVDSVPAKFKWLHGDKANEGFSPFYRLVACIINHRKRSEKREIKSIRESPLGDFAELCDRMIEG
jgi:hypothetical protein